MSIFQNYTADEFYRIGSQPSSKKAMGSATETVQQSAASSPTFIDYTTDAFMGIPKGILAAASDISGLAAAPFGYEVPDYFGLTTGAETAAGAVTEGITNFLTGFVPGLGIAGKIGKARRIAKLGSYVDEAATVARLAGNTYKAKALIGAKSMVKGAAAGAIADFAVFDGHEARLSNLLRDHAGLKDPVTEFLAADPNDSEIGGRLKNALEGLGIGGLTEGVFNSIRLYRAGYLNRSIGADPAEAMAREQLKIHREQLGQIKAAVPGLSDHQANVASWLIDQWGIDRSKLKIAGGEEAQKLYQQAGGEALEQEAGSQVKGFAAFAEDGRRVIGFLNSPDFSTAVEEISHVGRRQLFDKSVPAGARFGITDANIDDVAKWSGATQKDGQWVWDVASEEKFAKGFQKYLRDGEAPKGLEGLFKNMTDWMISLYRDITGSELDLTVSKEVKDAFDKVMAHGPGFEAAVSGKALGTPTLLRQAAPAPGTPGSTGPISAPSRALTEVPPGSLGLGKPGGVPDMPLNLERISSSSDAARTMKTIVEQERASMADAPLGLESVADAAKPVAESLARYIPEIDPLTLQRNMSTGKNSAWQLREASIELQGMRKYESSGAQRLFELASKGSGAGSDDIYEFLLGETALRAVAHQIKQRSREIARALVSMRIVPTPDREFKFLPMIPKAGEAIPSPAGMVPSPAAAAPSPAAAAPKPAAIPSPAAVTPEMSAEARANTIRQVIEQAGGEDAVRARMVRFAAAHRVGGADAVLKLAEGYRGKTAALTEYWMNSILSGPVTHAVNISSNILTAVYLPFERALGASVRNDWKTAGTALRQYIHLAQELSDAVRLAWTAFKLDENILTKVGTSERDMAGRAISGVGLGFKPETTGSMAADWVGKALNIPSRLLATEDEFFKQLQYRASYKTDLYVEGMSRFNGDSRAASQWAEDTFNRTVQDGQAYAESVVARRANLAADKAISNGDIPLSAKGSFISKYMADEKNWDPALGAMSQSALERAQYSTFSTPLDPSAPGFISPTRLAAGVQNLVTKNPYLRFLFPFIRTPTNLLNFTIERSVFGIPRNARMAFAEYGKALNHADASVRADAAGRLAFSAAITATVGMAVASGAITGGGPKSKAEREAKIQAGWQPYSIKLGNRYYSYKREDPFSSMIGLIADIGEGMQYADERNVKGLDAVVNTAVLALARNITNKTYLVGITNITNALSNPEQFGQNLTNQYVSSLIPFSSALSQSVYTVSGDPVLRDVRTMVDAVKAKIPYLAEDVAPKRNILGDVIEAPSRGARGLALINPVTYTDATPDPILREFDLLGHGFTPPKETRGAIDLTSFRTASGQMAYDRWLELHGKIQIRGRSLRDSLNRLISSKAYQKLSPVSTDDYDSPRVREVRAVISKYREAAYKQLLKESPELNQASRVDFANKQALRMGRSAQELLDLGNR
jgi:hypothetical protein